MAAVRARGTAHAQSPTLTYTITQAQNPALTIQRSVRCRPRWPRLPARRADHDHRRGGGPAERRRSTLLSRTDSLRFTSVATVQSDSTGAYSFTVEPTQTTIYKVACGRGHSTLLLVEPV